MSNWWFGNGLLLKVGVGMMAFALTLTVGTVVLTAVLRDKPERALAEQAAVKSPVKPPVEPLVRSYPPVEPKAEEAKPPLPEAEPVREPPP